MKKYQELVDYFYLSTWLSIPTMHHSAKFSMQIFTHKQLDFSILCKNILEINFFPRSFVGILYTIFKKIFILSTVHTGSGPALVVQDFLNNKDIAMTYFQGYKILQFF